MFNVHIRLFGAGLESTFPRAIPFSQAGLERTAGELLASFSAQGLTPEGLVLTKRNELFDYELRFTLFAGRAEFSLNAQRLKLEFANATGAGDLSTIADVTVRCHQCARPPGDALHHAIFYSHVAFDSADDFSGFFSPPGTRLSPEITQAGVIAYAVEPGWPEPIRVAVDLSQVLPGGAYLHLSTLLPAQTITADLLDQVRGGFERSATQCQLQFAPLS